MVIGSYTLVDFEGNVLPPGDITHDEWSDIYGADNALRVNGFGAPRAFFTPLVRKHPFPNVSYGEDYAVCLRLSRNYRVGRIFTSVYNCRRWEGNSDAALPVDKVNAHNEYKDFIRSIELMARIRENNTAEGGQRAGWQLFGNISDLSAGSLGDAFDNDEDYDDEDYDED